ncbi:hypothetical protein ONZ45_g3381 [Pleurotus djamor]|nr:hypothetical protein ONZ45_g3381 [Pleurotus djamor]
MVRAPNTISGLLRARSTRRFVSSIWNKRFYSSPDSPPDFGDYSIILPPEPFVFGVSHITPRHVPDSIQRPPYADSKSINKDPYAYPTTPLVPLGGSEEHRLRSAAALAKQVREFAGSLVKVSRRTRLTNKSISSYYPSRHTHPLFYIEAFRALVAPARPLENGDIINIDVTVFLNGYHGDTSQTFLVGDVDDQGRELVKWTNAALWRGIEACGPGRHFRDIGRAIQEYIKPFNVSISPQFTGHGISTTFHHPPWILHDANDEPGVMRPGHCFTIEPALIQGDIATGWIFPDGWTASTENCARSAQAEHMVLITEDGVDVLTK